MIGMFGELGVFNGLGKYGLGKLGEQLNQAVHWSPYGTVITILSASLNPGSWTITTTEALMATIGYTVVLATLGIKWFEWNTK